MVDPRFHASDPLSGPPAEMRPGNRLESALPGVVEDAGAQDLLSLPFLMRRLEAESEQVRMWAAFHLVGRWQEHCTEFVERLWATAEPEIRDSAITLIGKYQLHAYAFPLLRVFQANEAGLAAPAALALGQLRYEPARKLILQRLEGLLQHPEAATPELEDMARALLLFEEEELWQGLYARALAWQQNHAVHSVLFKLLCQHVATAQHVRQLADAYCRPRELFHDVHLTLHLVALTGRAGLCRYVQGRLGGGYSLATIYQNCLRVLGVEAAPGVEPLLEELAQCRSSSSGVEKLLHLLPRLFADLVSDPELAAPYLALAEGARGWAPRWEEAILKVRETEFALLACLPLVALLNQVEAACLANPRAEALRIARLYQSPLLAPEFMYRVLALLDEQGEQAAGAALSAAPMTGWLQDQDRDALWKVYTRQLRGLDYPFEQVLPQPWEYPVPNLLRRLADLLQPRFAAHLSAGRHQAVDYALEVFRRQPGPAVLDLVLRHAQALLPQHYHRLLELVAHVPDVRFLPLLVSQYREGEQDLQRLIRFICDVHQRPYPKAVLTAAQEAPLPRNHASLRLVCVACHGAFHYTLPALFVDEERLEQRQIPQAKDLWCPHAVQCKQCGAPVPLEPDEHFLSDLYSELLAARMFALTGQELSAVRNVRLIPFPVLEGRTLNPTEFLERVYRQLAQQQDAAQTLPLLAELGRFQLEVGNLAEAKAAFRRILAGPIAYPAALYYLGVIAFQEKNLFEARVHFSRLTQSFTKADFDNALDNPVEMAHHYLKLLDKREFKRSHFQLIP